MHTGTNPSKAVRNVACIVLKAHFQCHTNKPLACSAEVIGIASLQGHFMWKGSPDLGDHTNRALFSVIAQFSAEVEELGRIIFAATTDLKRRVAARNGNLLSQINREVELAKVLGEDQPRLDTKNLMALFVTVGIDFARKGNVDWQSALIEKAIACLQARRIEVQTVLIQLSYAPVDHPMIRDAILQAEMMPRELV
jgi:hypothetical protein